MPHSAEPVQILLVEDDPGDVFLTREAFAEAKVANDLTVVREGEEIQVDPELRSIEGFWREVVRLPKR